MRLFVTGATGLLGSHFVAQADAAGVCAAADLVALIRPSSQTAGLAQLGVAQRLGDLRDADSLADGMTGCSAVVHIASPKGGWQRPEVYEQQLLGGTRHVLAAMRRCGISRLVYISTISVHGLDPVSGGPVAEADAPGRRLVPFDHYGRAKVQAEALVRAAHDAGEVWATLLRPGWLFGPGDEGSYGRLADWMRRGLAHRIGRGDNRMPLVYVGNAAALIWHVLRRPPAGLGVYLYAFDGYLTQRDYLASLARASGSRRQPVYVPRALFLAAAALMETAAAGSGYRLRAPFTRYYGHLFGSSWQFDQRRLADELGFRPPLPPLEALARTEAWYRRSRGL